MCHSGRWNLSFDGRFENVDGHYGLRAIPDYDCVFYTEIETADRATQTYRGTVLGSYHHWIVLLYWRLWSPIQSGLIVWRDASNPWPELVEIRFIWRGYRRRQCNGGTGWLTSVRKGSGLFVGMLAPLVKLFGVVDTTTQYHQGYSCPTAGSLVPYGHYCIQDGQRLFLVYRTATRFGPYGSAMRSPSEDCCTSCGTSRCKCRYSTCSATAHDRSRLKCEGSRYFDYLDNQRETLLNLPDSLRMSGWFQALLEGVLSISRRVFIYRGIAIGLKNSECVCHLAGWETTICQRRTNRRQHYANTGSIIFFWMGSLVENVIKTCPVYYLCGFKTYVPYKNI